MGEMALVQQTRICDLKCLQDRQAFVTLLTPSMKQRQEVLPTPSRQLSSNQEQSSHCNSTQQDEQTSQVQAMASSNSTDPIFEPVFRNLEISGQEEVALPIGG